MRISGSWFEFQHFSAVEGLHWNHATSLFSAGQWRLKIAEFAAIGMECCVVMNVALPGAAYYPSEFNQRIPLACEDPLEEILASADDVNVRVYIGAGYLSAVGSSARALMSPEAVSLRVRIMEELATRYGSHPSFHGWYWPHEAKIDGHFDEAYIEYVNSASGLGRSLRPGSKILIAPFGSRFVARDAKFVRQIEALDVDHIAYQDEVGVQKTRTDELPGIFESLRWAHDRAGRSELWADIEMFQFQDRVYRSALLPAPFSRVRAQIEAISPFVSRILAYQFLGLMNHPASQAYAGHPDSMMLYRDFSEWQATAGHPPEETLLGGMLEGGRSDG